MQTIESVLRKEKVQLEKVIKEAEKRLRLAPKGQLRIVKKCRGEEYYYKNDGEGSGNGRYMKKSELNLVRSIAQRDYDVRLLKTTVERIKVIDTFLKKYEETSLKKLYGKINQSRKAMICAPVISDEEYVKQWQTVEYVGKAFTEESQEIITDKGERVRSKSEKIIADKLNMLGIPYRYEYPIVLEGNVKMYPDFTILRMPEREEIYLEHFGMLDDSNYGNNVIHKLTTYERNGIYLGVNLYITYETSKKPLNTRALDELIRKLLVVE